VGYVLLPANDAPDLDWNLLVPALHAFIELFDLVIWLQIDVASDEQARASLEALLDPAVPLCALQAHLSPYRRLHFAVPYCAPTAENLVADLQAACCVAPAFSLGQDVNRQAVMEEFDSAGIEAQEVNFSIGNIDAVEQELRRHCGFRVVEEVQNQKPAASEGAGEETEDLKAEGAGEEADAEANDGAAEDELQGATAEAPAGGEAGQAPDESSGAGEASLLSFFIGQPDVGASVEEAMKLRGAELLDGEEGPSLAYPVASYGFGCVPPRPWGTTWSSARTEVVVFAVQTRLIWAIIKRILGGLTGDESAAEGNAWEEQLQSEAPRQEEEGMPFEQGPEQGLAAEEKMSELELSIAEAAAVRIQSVVRGSMARRTVDAMYEEAEQGFAQDPEAGEEGDFGEDYQQGEEEQEGDVGDEEAYDQEQAEDYDEEGLGGEEEPGE